MSSFLSYSQRGEQFKPRTDFAGIRSQRSLQRPSLRREQQSIGLLARRRQALGKTAATAGAGALGMDAAGLGLDGEAHAGVTRSLEAALQQYSQLVQGLRAGELPAREAMALELRRLLFSPDGIVPRETLRTIGFLDTAFLLCRPQESEPLQFAGLWMLTHFSSGGHEDVGAVVESGGIGLLMSAAQKGSVRCTEQAIWSLGNIAGDTDVFRSQLLAAGLLDLLWQFLEATDEALAARGITTTASGGSADGLGCPPTLQPDSLLMNCTWALSNFLRFDAALSPEQTQRSLRALARQLPLNRPSTKENVLWTFALLNMHERFRPFLLDARLISLIINVLAEDDIRLFKPTLRVLGQLLCESIPEQTALLLQCGVLAPLKHLLASPDEDTRHDASWMVANACAGPPEHIEAVYRTDIFPILVNLAMSDTFEVVKEVLWAIGNAVAGATKLVLTGLVGNGVIPVLVKYLLRHDVQHGLIEVLLEAVFCVLRVGDEVARALQGPNRYMAQLQSHNLEDALEQLTVGHPSDLVRVKALNVQEWYFPSEEMGLSEVEYTRLRDRLIPRPSEDAVSYDPATRTFRDDSLPNVWLASAQTDDGADDDPGDDSGQALGVTHDSKFWGASGSGVPDGGAVAVPGAAVAAGPWGAVNAEPETGLFSDRDINDAGDIW